VHTIPPAYWTKVYFGGSSCGTRRSAEPDASCCSSAWPCSGWRLLHALECRPIFPFGGTW